MDSIKNFLTDKNNDSKKMIIATFVSFLILSSVTILAYNQAKNRTSTTVLPGGITYLGPSTTPSYQVTKSSPPVDQIPPPDSNTKWVEQKGKIFPYTFMYPSTLSLGIFPGDQFDPVTIFYENTNSNENIFLRVEDLSKMDNMKEYINKSKKDYALVWWKQYSWKGVADLSELTNSKGLKGWKASYTDGTGKTPYPMYFMEVPNRPELVVWMASSLIDTNTFAKIVDTLDWKK